MSRHFNKLAKEAILQITDNRTPLVPKKAVESLYEEMERQQLMTKVEYRLRTKYQPAKAMNNLRFVIVEGSEEETLVTFHEGAIHHRNIPEKKWKYIKDNVDDFLNGKTITIPFACTYEFRDELRKRRAIRFDGLPSMNIWGRSYIVDHGGEKTKNSFISGQSGVSMEVI